MENAYNNNSLKVRKLKGPSSDLFPLSVQNDNQQFFLSPNRYYNLPPSPLLDPYPLTDVTNLENLNSPLIRYLRSPGAKSSPGYKSPVLDSPEYRQMLGYQFHNSNPSISGSDSYGTRGSSRSPLSAIENLLTPPSRSKPLFHNPVKLEEDVIVMDAIQVGSTPGARGRYSSSSNSGSSSSSGNKFSHRTDTCRSWEDSGRCRYGSKCQFAHGKEELRPTRLPHKNKPEPQTPKSLTPGSGKTGSNTKSRFSYLQITPTQLTFPATAPTIPTTAAATDATTSWSPLDDGIDTALPFPASPKESPSHQDVEAYIQRILYGPSCKKRLPVFADICSE